MFENPLDPVWLVAVLAAGFGLAGLVLAVYAVRRRYPVLGVVFGVLAVAVFGVLGVAAGFVAIVLLLLGGAMDELTPGEGLSSLHEGSDVNGLCSLFLPL